MCVPESVSCVLPFDPQLQCRQEAVDQGDLGSLRSSPPPVFLTVSFLFTFILVFIFETETETMRGGGGMSCVWKQSKRREEKWGIYHHLPLRETPVVNIYRWCMCGRGLGHCSAPVWLKLGSDMGFLRLWLFICLVSSKFIFYLTHNSLKLYCRNTKTQKRQGTVNHRSTHLNL